MYYRDNGGLGCLILILLMMILGSILIAILFNPYFWIVVGILVLISTISRWINGKKANGSNQDNSYYRDEYRENSKYTTQTKSQFPVSEDDYTSGAVDVDVEVVDSDK